MGPPPPPARVSVCQSDRTIHGNFITNGLSDWVSQFSREERQEEEEEDEGFSL